MATATKKKRRTLFRRKRTLDPSIVIDYRNPEVLKRFVTDRGKIIPRRISGATAKQQRAICKAVKRAPSRQKWLLWQQVLSVQAVLKCAATAMTVILAAALLASIPKIRENKRCHEYAN